MSEPTTTKWDLALDGISQLEQRIGQVVGLIEANQRQVNQLTDQLIQVRKQVHDGDSTVLSMADARIAIHRTGTEERLAALTSRVATLETRATAQILSHLQNEVTERKERQAERDRSEARRARLDRWRAVAHRHVQVRVIRSQAAHDGRQFGIGPIGRLAGDGAPLDSPLEHDLSR